MPILVAPVAYQGLVDPEGEAAMARAAAAAGTVMCLSTLATMRPRQVAEAAPAGRRWFQLYRFRDAGVTRALVDEAVARGYEAIVLTVDAPRGGNRERDLRTGFEIPEELGVPSVEAALGSERALTIAETFDLMDPALDWAHLEELAAEGGVPVLVKGVLTAEDAALAVEHGAAGVVVSNHGGRQLDRCLATADALPEVVEAVAGRAPSSSTAASAAGSTSRSRSPSAPTRSSSAGPRSGASPPAARRARCGCSSCCATSSS